MFDALLEKFESKKNAYVTRDNNDFYLGKASAYAEAIEIVREEEKKWNDGWIPAEQKTPEDLMPVYVTCVRLTDDIKPWVVEGIYDSETGWESVASFLDGEKAKVIAWMPKKLPIPYFKEA